VVPIFSSRLIRWQKQHGRHDLPWQNTRDPYRIWLSEIMLQQTQVATVIPYYQAFLRRFPSIKKLAAAPLDEVLALWSGLGYYARGRNLHQAAQVIVAEHGGKFLRDIAAIMALPGIGRSTAAAIGVFAFGERCAILDGNVKRVFARYFGISGYPGAKEVEAQLWQQAEQLLPKKAADGNIETYTQALMDLGATLCTRSKPQCDRCPLHKDCVAYQQNRVAELPTPKPKKTLPQKEIALLMLLNHGEILLEKRVTSGIWGGLWSFPEMLVNGNAAAFCMRRYGVKTAVMQELAPLDHSFTHFKLRIYPRCLRVVSGEFLPQEQAARLVWLNLDDALAAAIPAPARKLIRSINI